MALLTIDRLVSRLQRKIRVFIMIKLLIPPAGFRVAVLTFLAEFAFVFVITLMTGHAFFGQAAVAVLWMT